MSKLEEAIRRSQRIESAPMGFGSAKPAARPSMLTGLIASDAAGLNSTAGADFVILDLGSGEITEADLAKLSSSAVIGASGKLNPSASAALRKAGLDFLTFEPAHTAAASLLDEDLGYVLTMPAEPEESYLRSLDAFSLDALLVTAPAMPLTAAQQIGISRIATLARKPLLCRLNGAVSSEDLQCLRAAGVVAVLTADPSQLEGLKEQVTSLPARRQRREERSVVSLPRGQAPPEAEDDDDDGEDD